MNQQSSPDSSTSSSGDAVSRRAYELWEKEGRPEGSDIRHWLQAEQELGASRSKSGDRPQENSALRRNDPAASSRTGHPDTRPTQNSQSSSRPSAAAPAPAVRDAKSGNGASFTREKNGNTQIGQGAGKRKPSNAPAL